VAAGDGGFDYRSGLSVDIMRAVRGETNDGGHDGIDTH